MKNFKKVMALVIATMMIVNTLTVFAAPATATAGSYDPTLTVNGTDSGETIKFFKLVEWVESGTGNVKGWKARTPYESILDEATLTKVLVSEGKATQDDVNAGKAANVGDDLPPIGITSELAGQLARASANDTAVQSGTTTTLDVTTSTDLGPGIYMAIATPKDQDTIYNPVFVSSDFNLTNNSATISVGDLYAPEATAKKSKPELKKVAKTSEQVWADQKWNTTAIGDIVTYTATTQIPSYGDLYVNPYFAVRDTLTDLELITDSVTLKKPAGLTGSEYTLTATKAGFEIVFTSAYLKSLAGTATDVEIEYKARVSTTAPVNINLEKNEISTEFSHIPSSESDHAFKKDRTNHYTFNLDASGLGMTSDQFGKITSELVKVGQNSDGSWITSERVYSQVDPRNYYQGPLAGAKFGLYTDAQCTNEYHTHDKDGNDTGVFNLVSGTDGRFEIKGLDAGTYYLQEKEAPAGYIKDTSIHKIEISVTTDDHVNVTEYTTDGKNWISEEDYNKLSATQQAAYKSYTYETEVLLSYEVKVDGQLTAHYDFNNKGPDAEIVWDDQTQGKDKPIENPFKIINKKGVELPSTGGMGTTLFYAIGAILVLGAGILLVSKRRMSAY